MLLTKKSWFIAICLVLSMLFLTTGCGNEPAKSEQPKSEQTQPKQAQSVETNSDTDDVSAAKQTFINYHRAITNKNYRAAYETLSYAQRDIIGDYDSYVAGFEDTISSEVSDMILTSSDEDSCTFDYGITARDRYQGDNVKIQIFKGQVTMAKDGGLWYIRNNQAKKVDEQISNEMENEQKTRLATEQKAREKKLGETSAGNDLEKATTWANKASDKDYLENLQPFALANLIKKASGILGLFQDSDTASLENYAMAMSLLAQQEKERNTPISRDVALYFEYEAQISAVYANMDNKNLGLLDKAAALAIAYKLSGEQEEVEERIRKVADSCGADLSSYAETEAIRRIVNILKDL